MRDPSTHMNLTDLASIWLKVSYLFFYCIQDLFFTVIEMLWGIGLGREFHVLNIGQVHSSHLPEKT